MESDDLQHESKNYAAETFDGAVKAVSDVDLAGKIAGKAQSICLYGEKVSSPIQLEDEE
ncbi:MAG: hypothetical protein KGQ56_03220 [Acidobacteria bacterium]|nr:hypothetical protein [Acidobacteriota bacterium]